MTMRTTDERYLRGALLLITAFLAAETAAGFVAHSMALLADAGHMLADVAALVGSIWAARLAARPPAGLWTYGWRRAEILSAAANGVTLVAVALLITVEAIRRLVSPPPVTGSIVVVTAIVGLCVNVAATVILGRAERRNLNVRGAFAHILTDAYAFAGTAVAGAIVMLTGWRRADALASLFVVALIVRAAWQLLRDSGRILLQAAPEALDLAEIRAHLTDVPHVVDVHDLHIWTVTSGLPTLSAHVVVEDHCFDTGHAPQLLDALQRCLAGHFDVTHATFQLEPRTHLAHEPDAHV